MSEIYGTDAFSPKEIANRVRNVGVAKARLPALPMLMLGILAGAFIGLGALNFTLVKSDPSLSFATSQLLGGLAFSMGLILVIIAGAELFTGNNLLAMAWADRLISTRELLRNWAIVCVANLIGAIGLAVMVFFSGHLDMNNGAIADTYVKIAVAKCSIPFWSAFLKGMLCNVLVCMAVWMALAGRSVIDKTIAIIFPITAFVAAGFEHSIANMYFIPMGWLIQQFGETSVHTTAITLTGLFRNLVPVILGNLVGGSVLVALVYRVIYKRSDKVEE